MNKVFILAILSTMLLGCGVFSKTNSSKTSKDTPNTMNDNSIVNKYWKLVTLDGQPVKMSENQDREQYFMLKEGGAINGFAGCNTFNGTYQLETGNRIRFSEHLAVTMKVCPDQEIKESEFLEVFKLANNYTIHGDTLSLNVGKRSPLAVFNAVYF